MKDDHFALNKQSLTPAQNTAIDLPKLKSETIPGVNVKRTAGCNPGVVQPADVPRHSTEQPNNPDCAQFLCDAGCRTRYRTRRLPRIAKKHLKTKERPPGGGVNYIFELLTREDEMRNLSSCPAKAALREYYFWVMNRQVSCALAERLIQFNSILVLLADTGKNQQNKGARCTC